MSTNLRDITPTELAPHITAVLEGVKELPVEQQQAVLEAAAATARATSELRNRLYVTGSVLANLKR